VAGFFMRGTIAGMGKTIEQLAADNLRQSKSLSSLQDEMMSMLHAHALREPSIDSRQVIAWLQLLYDEVQVGLGESKHFRK
jgi:hypothetical protein